MVQSSQHKYHICKSKTVTGSLKTKIYQCYIRKTLKNVHKKHKNENFVKQTNAFLSHVLRIIQPKNQIPRPKSVSCSVFTDRQTDTHTHRVTTVGTLPRFQDFFLQPIIKDRPNRDEQSKRYQQSQVRHQLQFYPHIAL